MKPILVETGKCRFCDKTATMKIAKETDTSQFFWICQEHYEKAGLDKYLSVRWDDSKPYLRLAREGDRNANPSRS